MRICAICCGLLGLVAAVPAADLPLVRWEGRTMGSPYTVQVAGTNLNPERIERLRDEIERRLKEINRQMSHYQPDSELSRFNRAPAHTSFKVSPEFARVTRFSLELFRKSGGAFEPTLAPVVNLWGFGEKTEDRSIPPEPELRRVLETTGAQHLTVTPDDELVKQIPELSINLSAVAKGFGVDAMIEVLRREGLTNVYASIAGEVRVLGHNARGTKWQVGISAPVAHWRETDPMAAAVSLSDQALSTSGDYQKFFTDAQGRRLSHLVDPRTGWPVQHDVTGVSVVATDGMTADALCTTLFVLGREAGLNFIESWTNAAALFIMRESDGTFHLAPSSRFEAMTGFKP